MPIRSLSGHRWVKKHGTLVTTGRRPAEGIEGEAAAGLLSVVITLGFLALFFLILDLLVSSPGEEGAAFDAGVLFSVVVLALTGVFVLIYGRYRSGKMGIPRLIHAGWTFQIAYCFIVSYIELNRPAEPGVPYTGLSFVAIVIVLFPMFVPVTLKKTLLASLLAASMGPLALLVYRTVHGSPWPEAAAYTSYIANYVVIWVVLRTSKQLQIMNREVERAKRMGSYELKELLGKGGMGEVWKADHQLLRRPAAVKLIRPEALGGREGEGATTVRRFEREAQATANLHSSHTIQLYDFGRTAQGTFFYVMELLDGIDMKSLVERFGPQSPERVCRMTEQACDSLEDAHRSGLIHRDVKPANLYLCRYGHRLDHVKVLDFGLVKPREDEFGSQLTGEGVIAGTPAFLPPETARESVADARSDIYSLGCVAYWLLTGVLVFDRGTAMQTVLAHIEEEPLPPSERSEIDVPEELDRIVLACLEKDPAKRPQSAADLARMLRETGLGEKWTKERAERWWEVHLPAGE